MPLPDLTDPLPAVKAATHTNPQIVAVHRLVTLRVRQLFSSVVISVESLRANVSIYLDAISVLVRIFIECAPSLLIFLSCPNNDP